MRTKLALIIALMSVLSVGGWGAYKIGKDNGLLRVENVELKRQIDVLKKNQKSIESLEASIDLCFGQVDLAQAAGERWKEAFENRPVTKWEVVRAEVPVEVIPEGTPCEAGLARLATWINKEAQSGRIQ